MPDFANSEQSKSTVGYSGVLMGGGGGDGVGKV